MPSKSSLKEQIKKRLERDAVYESSIKKRITKTVGVTEDIIFARVEQQFIALAPHIKLKPRSSFNRKLKTKNPQAIAMAYARHILGDFPVSPVLQNLFFNSRSTIIVDDVSWSAPLNVDSVQWTNLPIKLFAAVRSGQSVYKTVTKDMLSKKETHTVVSLRHELQNVRQMFVYAIAIHEGASTGLALKIARTDNVKLDHTPKDRELIRFIVRYHKELRDFNSVLDYASAMIAQNAEWSIAGRTPTSVMRGHEEWVRALNKAAYMGSFSWDGLNYKDLQFEQGYAHHWHFYQIKTSKELAKEGENMRHCVSSYRDKCREGRCAIFTVRYKHQNKNHPIVVFEGLPYEKCLTIEVSNEGQIVQVRGFANRMPFHVETQAVDYWAAQNGLRTTSYSY